MEPYHQVFPDSLDPIATLTLTRKTGAIPKGTYRFIECYCTDPECDCRRVLLLVLNDKRKEKAAISFVFDQDGPLAGPYLEPSAKSAAYASELLEFFVDSLNAGPDWLERMYRHYRAVRQKVQGKKYRGKALPKPGRLRYQAMPSPDLQVLIEQSLQTMAAGHPAAASRARRPAAGAGDARKKSPASAEKGLDCLVTLYQKLGAGGASIADHAAIQDHLQQYLKANDEAAEELAALLPALCQQSPEDDERIEAALRLLFDALDILRLELERRRPAARVRMEKLQSALAQHIYLENEDLDLCATVSQILLQSRVEILPVLREAHSRLMQDGAARSDLLDEPGEEIMAGIARSLDSMGLTSPYEGAEALLQLFALNEPEMQIALIAEMFSAENPLLREISALMLFHPDGEVRLGVSELLPTLDGGAISSLTLRRLIVSRNWFPDEIRKNVDQAVSNARRARVECAPLAGSPAVTVHASTIDGAGAQSFQVVVPDGKGFYSCSILLKQGVGVADAFVVALANKRELNDFLGMLREEASFIETTCEHLDLRVCQALADGVRYGNAPSYWLLRIAELLGCDQWQAAGLDTHKELAQLRDYMAALFPKLLDEQEYRSALEESADWQASEPILSSWFEDDDTVDREIEASRGKRKSFDAALAVERIQMGVMEKRRAVWLERLVVTTLWLKSSKKAPLPWYRMFHVAQAVADTGVSLGDIPLMHAIAELSFEAFMQRSVSGGPEVGAAK